MGEQEQCPDNLPTYNAGGVCSDHNPAGFYNAGQSQQTGQQLLSWCGGNDDQNTETYVVDLDNNGYVNEDGFTYMTMYQVMPDGSAMLGNPKQWQVAVYTQGQGGSDNAGCDNNWWYGFYQTAG